MCLRCLALGKDVGKKEWVTSCPKTAQLPGSWLRSHHDNHHHYPVKETLELRKREQVQILPWKNLPAQHSASCPTPPCLWLFHLQNEGKLFFLVSSIQLTPGQEQWNSCSSKWFPENINYKVNWSRRLYSPDHPTISHRLCMSPLTEIGDEKSKTQKGNLSR